MARATDYFLREAEGQNGGSKMMALLTLDRQFSQTHTLEFI
jgi:hypothetical protein